MCPHGVPLTVGGSLRCLTRLQKVSTEHAWLECTENERSVLPQCPLLSAVYALNRMCLQPARAHGPTACRCCRMQSTWLAACRLLACTRTHGSTSGTWYVYCSNQLFLVVATHQACTILWCLCGGFVCTNGDLCICHPTVTDYVCMVCMVWLPVQVTDMLVSRAIGPAAQAM
jgi:hypothetical protein